MRSAIWIMVVVLAAGILVQEGEGVEPVLDQEGDVYGSRTWAGNGGGTQLYKCAQQVQPTLRHLYRVEVVHTWNEDISAGDLNLRVLGVNNGGPDTPGIVVLGSLTLSLPDIAQPHTHPKVLTFDFSTSPVDLDGYLNGVGNMFILLEFTGDVPGTYKLDTSTVANGEYSRPFYQMTDGANWLLKPTQDMVFRTYGLATLPPKGTAILIR